METWAVKVITLFLILILTLVFGLLPLPIVKRIRAGAEWRSTRSTADKILSLLNCFGGGVFMGTAFLHLLPEVRENLQEIFPDGSGLASELPLAECIASAGFFLIMLLEHFIMVLQHSHNDISMTSSLDNSVIEQEVESAAENTPLMQDTQPLEGNGEKSENNAYGTTGQTSLVASDKHKDPRPMPDPILIHSSPNDPSTRALASGDLVIKKRSRARQPASNPLDVEVSFNRPSHHQRHHEDPRQLSGLRSFVLLLALSLHTIFEGMALGLQSTETQVWTLFLALSFHKVVIAFTLGLHFAENLSSMCRMVVFILIFSLMAPLGMVVGIGVSSAGESHAKDISSAVLQGLATGTFLYVTFFEVLQKEVGQREHSLTKVLAIVVGFTCMLGLVFLEISQE